MCTVQYDSYQPYVAPDIEIHFMGHTNSILIRYTGSWLPWWNDPGDHRWTVLTAIFYTCAPVATPQQDPLKPNQTETSQSGKGTSLKEGMGSVQSRMWLSVEKFRKN